MPDGMTDLEQRRAGPISEAYNMDCMEYMRQFPDKHFELSVVDPPYGLSIDKATGHLKKYGQMQTVNDIGIPDGYFEELIRVSKWQIVWGGNYFELPPSRGFIFWYKRNPVHTYADGEYAWTNFDKNAKCFDFPFWGTHGSDQHRIHPTQKPVALYKWIFENYARPGWKILDTHLGSGSSRIAAYDMGLDFYATELDPDYFEAMEKRFQAHIARPQLFAPSEQYQFKQASIFEDL